MYSDGIWRIFEPNDPIPTEMTSSILRNFLCTICGVRVWASDTYIHEEWHNVHRD